MKYIFKYLINGDLAINKNSSYKVNYNSLNTMINSETISIEKSISFSDGLITDCKENQTLSYLSLSVDLRDNFDITNEEHYKNVKKSVTEILNYFIETYRILTVNTSLDISKEKLIMNLQVFESVDNVLNSVKFDKFLPLPDQEVIVKEKKIGTKKLIQLLEKGQSASVSDQIMLKAKEEMLNKNNYLLTVILSETAFEVFIQNILIRICDSRGVTELPVGKNGNLRDYSEVIMNGNIKDHLIKKYMRSLLNFNVSKLKEYMLWHEYTYDLRNQIIHKGDLNISKAAAEKAYYSVHNLIKKVNDLVDARIDLI